MEKLLSLINDKSYLIVCDDNDAIKYLIKKINNYFKNKLVDISYITFNELSSKLNFLKTDEIVLTVMDAFNLSYDIANLYIDNILQTNYLINNNCDNDKLLQIYEIKKFLKELNLYKKDELINHYLSNKEVVVYSSYLDEFKKYLLKDINYTFVTCLNEDIKEVKADIIDFKTINEEIAYTCEDIIDKLNKGINKKDIYLVCESNDYLYTLKRISKYFNLDFDVKENVSLMSIKFVRNLVDKYFYNKFDEIDASKFNNEESSLYKQVVSIINKYVKYSDKLCYKEFLLNKLKSTNKKYEHNKNAINVISLDEAFYLSKYDTNAYVYILGMYQGNIPKIKKDEDYYSDIVKKENKVFDSSLINTNNQKIVKEIINNFKNLVLSFSKSSNFSEYLISSIVNVLDANLTKKEFYISKYSNLYNKEVYYKKYDTFSKYGTKDESLSSLHAVYNDNLYGSYDNQYKGIDYNDVLNCLGNKLSLSYTSMDQYNKCAFAYYLKYILKINDYKGSFSLFIGNVYHYVLEMHFKNKNFDFEKEYNYVYKKECESYQLTACELILMGKLKEELKDVIKYLDEQLNYINYKNSEFEKYVKIESKLDYNGNVINTKFDGKIDKMLYKKIELDNGEEASLVAIVDYKTSTNIKFEIELVAYGLSLQLPVYAYLADNMENMGNVIVGALFIQPVLSSQLIDCQENEDGYLRAKNAIRRMQGCYNFDLTGENKFIDEKMIIRSKALSTEDIRGFVETVKYTIDETFYKIASAQFDINPKKVDQKEYSCEYCEFADICYKKEANYVKISLKKEGNNA